MKTRKNFSLSSDALNLLRQLADKHAASNESYMIERLILKEAKAKKIATNGKQE